MKWIDINNQKPENGQFCIVAARVGSKSVAQFVVCEWINDHFEYNEQVEEYFDEYPSELTTHWIQFPDDPK